MNGIEEMRTSEKTTEDIPTQIELSTNRPWVVAHTRARHEKKLAQFLDRDGIRHFLPLAQNVSRAGGRRRCYEVPLFPGYVFVSCEKEMLGELYRSDCIAGLIPVFDQEELVEQLRRIEAATSGEYRLQPCDCVQAGKRIRFNSGPLEGYEGIVVKRKGEERVILNVEVIQRAVSVEADVWDLEILEH